MADTFPLPFSVDAVEVLAATKALMFAHELGLPAIVLEGDSKHTIESLKGDDESLADIGHLIEEAKQYGRQFNVIQYRHVKREHNKAFLDMQVLASFRCGWRMFLHISLL